MSEFDDIFKKVEDGAKTGNPTMALARHAPMTLEEETAPFLLFLMGDSIDVIASKTAKPKEILAVTAKANLWEERKAQLVRDNVNIPAEIQKNLINMLLATTYMAVQSELTQVMSGELDASQAKFVPKSIGALRGLIDMVNIVNKIEGPISPVIKGNNVQVNMGVNGAPRTKAEMLREMAANTNASPAKEE